MRARAIIFDNQKVLLIHRVKNGSEYWVFPGGGVDNKEKADEAVKRECLEELGLNVLVKHLIDKCVNNKGQMEHYYLCSIVDGKLGSGIGDEAKIKDPENVYLLEFVSLEKLIKINLYPKKMKEKVIKVLTANSD